MEEEDFLGLEQELRALCTQMGVPEIVEDRFFVRRETSDTPGFLLPPRSRVLAQLDAIDRYMSLYDGAVFKRSMTKITALLQNDRGPGATSPSVPSTAFIVVSSRGGAAEETIDLSQLPDLTELRGQLQDLRNRLSEA